MQALSWVMSERCNPYFFGSDSARLGELRMANSERLPDEPITTVGQSSLLGSGSAGLGVLKLRFCPPFFTACLAATTVYQYALSKSSENVHSCDRVLF